MRTVLLKLFSLDILVLSRPFPFLRQIPNLSYCFPYSWLSLVFRCWLLSSVRSCSLSSSRTSSKIMEIPMNHRFRFWELMKGESCPACIKKYSYRIFYPCKLLSLRGLSLMRKCKKSCNNTTIFYISTSTMIQLLSRLLSPWEENKFPNNYDTLAINSTFTVTVSMECSTRFAVDCLGPC